MGPRLTPPGGIEERFYFNWLISTLYCIFHCSMFWEGRLSSLLLLLLYNFENDNNCDSLGGCQARGKVKVKYNLYSLLYNNVPSFQSIPFQLNFKLSSFQFFGHLPWDIGRQQSRKQSGWQEDRREADTHVLCCWLGYKMSTYTLQNVSMNMKISASSVRPSSDYLA